MWPALKLSREVKWYHSGQSKFLSPSLIIKFSSYIRKTATALYIRLTRTLCTIFIAPELPRQQLLSEKLNVGLGTINLHSPRPSCLQQVAGGKPLEVDKPGYLPGM